MFGALTRCRTFLLKDTLLTLNTFPAIGNAPEGTSYRPGVLGLVLPNQFRCQRSRMSPKCSKQIERHLSPRAWKPAGLLNLISLPTLSPDRRHSIEAVAPNRLQRRMRSGGAERDRTVDPLLAKQVLSQLSYSPTAKNAWSVRQRWWAWVDSNYRPHPYQGCALTN